MRINDIPNFSFNTLRAQTTKMTMPLQPKAIHDEMDSATFDEFGRMTANLGLEAQPPVPGSQNVTLYPFVNPPTELLDGTLLPRADVEVTPISSASDGTQIWRITHNGVDTHPIHFHLYDVQLLNRVAWDNIVTMPDANEPGLEGHRPHRRHCRARSMALRPIIPVLPFEVPDGVRTLNPMMPLGETGMFNNIDAQGIPTAAIINDLVNFGWEYVWHCHILSHEEMDMMRPQLLAVPPLIPNGLSFTETDGVVTLNWNDNSITETAFVVQKQDGANWVDVATITSPLDQPNIHQPRSFELEEPFDPNAFPVYRIVAQNTVGYLGAGGAFPSMTVTSVSSTLVVGYPPTAPSNLRDPTSGRISA